MEKKEATQVTGCRKCNKGQEKLQLFLVTFGIVLLGLSIYGAVRLVQDIISSF
jgi:hypothetical protein